MENMRAVEKMFLSCLQFSFNKKYSSLRTFWTDGQIQLHFSTEMNHSGYVSTPHYNLGHALYLPTNQEFSYVLQAPTGHVIMITLWNYDCDRIFARSLFWAGSNVKTFSFHSECCTPFPTSA
jgi:hypothetical protein